MILIEDKQILSGSAISVHSWERDLQSSLVKFLVQPSDRVLELGLGLAMAYGEIDKLRPKSHTVVELSEDVIRHHIALGKKFSDLIRGDWRDIVETFEDASFDVVYYDADPQNLVEFDGKLEASWQFVEGAIRQCHRVLRPKGRLGFLDFSCMISTDLEKKRNIINQGFSIENQEISIDPPNECSYAPREFGDCIFDKRNDLTQPVIVWLVSSRHTLSLLHETTV